MSPQVFGVIRSASTHQERRHILLRIATRPPRQKLTLSPVRQSDFTSTSAPNCSSSRADHTPSQYWAVAQSQSAASPPFLATMLRHASRRAAIHPDLAPAAFLERVFQNWRSVRLQSTRQARPVHVEASRLLFFVTFECGLPDSVGTNRGSQFAGCSPERVTLEKALDCTDFVEQSHG